MFECEARESYFHHSLIHSTHTYHLCNLEHSLISLTRNESTRIRILNSRSNSGTEDAKPIRNLYDLSLKLLRCMSELSVAATSHIKDTMTTSSSSNTDEKDTGTNCIENLDEAYSLEPSVDTFSLLYELLRFLVSEFESCLLYTSPSPRD